MNKLTKRLSHLRQKEHKRLRRYKSIFKRVKPYMDKDTYWRLTEGSCMNCGYLCVDGCELKCTRDSSEDEYKFIPINSLGACHAYYEGDMDLLDGSLKERPWEYE